MPDLPETLIAANLDNTWHDTAEAVVDNWIGKVYRLTALDRKQPFKAGVDPADPLGLRSAR
jgi:homoserine O-succinyltransferase